jgi:hypothetical protein
VRRWREEWGAEAQPGGTAELDRAQGTWEGVDLGVGRAGRVATTMIFSLRAGMATPRAQIATQRVVVPATSLEGLRRMIFSVPVRPSKLCTAMPLWNMSLYVSRVCCSGCSTIDDVSAWKLTLIWQWLWYVSRRSLGWFLLTGRKKLKVIFNVLEANLSRKITESLQLIVAFVPLVVGDAACQNIAPYAISREISQIHSISASGSLSI